MIYKKNIFPTRLEMVNRIAVELEAIIETTLKKKSSFRLVIGGGRTQEELNDRIVANGNKVKEWQRVFIFLSDERCVPHTHELSNYRMNMDSLIIPMKMPKHNLHAFYIEKDTARSLNAYSELFHNFMDNQDNTLFDLAILGLGPDGHTASLFPGSSALNEHKLLTATGGLGPEGFQRITLTYPAINASRHVWIMAAGKAKRKAVGNIINGTDDPQNCPVQLIQPTSGKVTLWLDADTAI